MANVGGIEPGKLDCLALIVCDLVIEDVRTHNKTIVGIFNRISAVGFPCIQPRLTVFAALSEGHGKATLTIRLNRIENEQTLLAVEGEAHFRDPLLVTDFVFQIQNVMFPEPGLYSVSIHQGEEMLRSRRFEVAQITDNK